MICINPNGEARTLSESEFVELLPVVERLTRKAARAAEKLARFYGHLDRDDPEWRLLCHSLAGIICSWARSIALLGAEPHELWSVRFSSHAGPIDWQLPGWHVMGAMRPAS